MRYVLDVPIGLEWVVTEPSSDKANRRVLRALKIASQARIGVYDCLYIALAWVF
jgi:hypothetical protein